MSKRAGAFSGLLFVATAATGCGVLICNLATHYASGMRVAFTVH